MTGYITLPFKPLNKYTDEQKKILIRDFQYAAFWIMKQHLNEFNECPVFEDDDVQEIRVQSEYYPSDLVRYEMIYYFEKQDFDELKRLFNCSYELTYQNRKKQWNTYEVLAKCSFTTGFFLGGILLLSGSRVLKYNEKTANVLVSLCVPVSVLFTEYLTHMLD